MKKVFGDSAEGMRFVKSPLKYLPEAFGAQCLWAFHEEKRNASPQMKSQGCGRNAVTFSDHRTEGVKEKAADQIDQLLFMERVTRLELATSTLARWRSTG